MAKELDTEDGNKQVRRRTGRYPRARIVRRRDQRSGSRDQRYRGVGAECVSDAAQSQDGVLHGATIWRLAYGDDIRPRSLRLHPVARRVVGLLSQLQRTGEARGHRDECQSGRHCARDDARAKGESHHLSDVHSHVAGSQTIRPARDESSRVRVNETPSCAMAEIIRRKIGPEMIP